jgi:hypothetical protein
MNEKRRAALANLLVGCDIAVMRTQLLMRNSATRRGYSTIFRQLVKQIRRKLTMGQKPVR